MDRNPIKAVRTSLLLVLVGATFAGFRAHAAPTFSPGELNGPGSILWFCDLDGDGRKDIVVADEKALKIFRQDPVHGFSREPQQLYHLGEQPCIVWPARLDKKAESLLVMTRDGVTELAFTNCATPPVRQYFIRRPTIVPDTLDDGEDGILSLPMSAETGHRWPLVLRGVWLGLPRRRASRGRRLTIGG